MSSLELLPSGACVLKPVLDDGTIVAVLKGFALDLLHRLLKFRRFYNVLVIKATIFLYSVFYVIFMHEYGLGHGVINELGLFNSNGSADRVKVQPVLVSNLALHLIDPFLNLREGLAKAHAIEEGVV